MLEVYFYYVYLQLSVEEVFAYDVSISNHFKTRDSKQVNRKHLLILNFGS